MLSGASLYILRPEKWPEYSWPPAEAPTTSVCSLFCGVRVGAASKGRCTFGAQTSSSLSLGAGSRADAEKHSWLLLSGMLVVLRTSRKLSFGIAPPPVEGQALDPS